MDYLLHVADASARHMMVLTLSADDVKNSAIDVVFEYLGNQKPQELVARGILPQGQLGDFDALQQLIFDRDEQGLFIREEINLDANGKDLDPDAPISSAFRPAQRDGVEYKRCDISISGGTPNTVYGGGGTSGTGNNTGLGGGEISGTGANTVDGGVGTFGTSTNTSSGGTNGNTVSGGNGQTGSVDELARLMFLHQIAVGKLIDVTKELAELSDTIAWAEAENLIAIDVQKAAYTLTEKGKRRHDSFMEEAQNLIIRYDIFSDVDVTADGKIYFDTNLGKDLRIPIYEIEGIDPYRARFILGLNDGEWNNLDDWTTLSHSESWYHEIFEPIDEAPSVDDIGKAQLERVLEAGKEKLRHEQR